MYKHVVVTGGAGFVGSNLVHEVAKRYPEADLTVVDDFRSGYFKNLEGFKGDVITGDVAQLDLKHYFGGRKVDLVFHLASITDTTDHNSSGRRTIMSSRGAISSIISRAAKRAWF